MKRTLLLSLDTNTGVIRSYLGKGNVCEKVEEAQIQPWNEEVKKKGDVIKGLIDDIRATSLVIAGLKIATEDAKAGRNNDSA